MPAPSDISSILMNLALVSEITHHLAYFQLFGWLIFVIKEHKLNLNSAFNVTTSYKRHRARPREFFCLCKPFPTSMTTPSLTHHQKFPHESTPEIFPNLHHLDSPSSFTDYICFHDAQAKAKQQTHKPSSPACFSDHRYRLPLTYVSQCKNVHTFTKDDRPYLDILA